jgi:CRISPR-associated protein Cmr6
MQQRQSPSAPSTGAIYPLPQDTRVVAAQAVTKCQNLGLIFDRYIAYYVPDRRNPGRWDLDKQRQMGSIRSLPSDQRLMRAYRRRWQQVVDDAGAITFIAQTAARFVTGLGRNSPLEVGFTFHRLHGFPIIPGSGLKGLARAYAQLVKGYGEDDPDFCSIFGWGPEDASAPESPEAGEDAETKTSGAAGQAIFFDAIPADDRPGLDIDIMNPHYPRYYQDDEPPADWQSPVPVPFLTVAHRTNFLFAVGWRGTADPHLHQLAVDWLQGGLRELGAGAKTTAGYGYWVIVSDRRGSAKIPASATTIASPASVSPPPATPALSVALEWRRATVVDIDTSKKHRGRLRDAQEPDLELSFDVRLIEGDTPGKKSVVEYQREKVDDHWRVVKVRRAR